MPTQGVSCGSGDGGGAIAGGGVLGAGEGKEIRWRERRLMDRMEVESEEVMMPMLCATGRSARVTPSQESPETLPSEVLEQMKAPSKEKAHRRKSTSGSSDPETQPAMAEGGVVEGEVGWGKGEERGISEKRWTLTRSPSRGAAEGSDSDRAPAYPHRRVGFAYRRGGGGCRPGHAEPRSVPAKRDRDLGHRLLGVKGEPGKILMLGAGRGGEREVGKEGDFFFHEVDQVGSGKRMVGGGQDCGRSDIMLKRKGKKAVH